MKRIKKIVAIAATSILLCGFTGQAAEGSAEVAASQGHTHVYTEQPGETTCIASHTQYQHTYLSGVEVAPTGEITKRFYSTCYVVLFAYRVVYRCNIDNCGDQYDKTKTESRHMDCGQ